mgnify:CR=1 FL=1
MGQFVVAEDEDLEGGDHEEVFGEEGEHLVGEVQLGVSVAFGVAEEDC